jgi:hypothetical protein
VIRAGDYILLEDPMSVCQVLKVHGNALYIEKIMSRHRQIIDLLSVVRLTPHETADLLLRQWGLGVLNPVPPDRGNYR